MAKEDGKVMSVNQIFDKSYWDILDLYHYLNVKVKTLYAMIYDIPHYRIGKLIRFKKEEIEAWMENKRENDHDVKIQQRGKRKLTESANKDINRLIRKTIDQTKEEDYNLDHGKSDRIEGHSKEVKNGSI
jgi:excisionase family DNA binding protein